MTSFNPDQVSSTAQTLMSTRPFFRAKFRTTFSFMSVGTSEAALGHETHSIPLEARAFLNPANLFSYSVRDRVKKCTKSILGAGFFKTTTGRGKEPSNLK